MTRPLFFLAMSLACAALPGWGEVANRPPGQPKPLKQMIKVMHMKASQRIAPEDLQAQSAAATTIPFWHYSTVSPLDGKTYQGTMVGRNPYFNGHRTTYVPTDIVPVIFTFPDGTVFDPTVFDSCLGDSVVNVVTQSPMFKNAGFTMNGANVGTTQYTDAFQRANFWQHVAGTPYHTLLTPKVLPAINVSVPLASGYTDVNFNGCAFGNMDINWWDDYVQTTLIPQLASQGVNPTVFPIFLFNAVFEYDSSPLNCCILGYHNAFNSNNVLQTYSISSFDTSGAFGGDISVTSHEIAEWLDDPDTNNPTPAWGNIGQVSGCQANLEVGDPLSPGGLTPTNPFYVTMPNGFTYTLQELAYFSWFFREVPSIGSGGLYSNNGTLGSAQTLCH